MMSAQPSRAESSDSRERAEGQVLVILALGIISMLAMVGLVIDGGNAFAQQRMAQNATDAAATAGAVSIAQHLVTGSGTDAAVLAAVQAALDANATTLASAVYTNVSGDPIWVAVGAAPSAAIPSGAAGVAVSGRRTFGTFFARAIGLPTFTATTDATAVAGSLTGICPADAGCGIWPVTFPVTTVSCDHNGDPVLGVDAWPTTGAILEVPLCRNGPGNVGWLDWYPPAGGASELAETILHPNNPELEIPDWYFVTSTGNVNSSQVEDALRTYQDDLVIVPLFSATCRTDPGEDGNDLPLPCTTTRGTGQNQYYLLAAWAGFRLCGPLTAGCEAVAEGAYVSGSPSECTTGNGATSCLWGRFEQIVYSGTISASPPNPGGGPQAVGVQLIR